MKSWQTGTRYEMEDLCTGKSGQLEGTDTGNVRVWVKYPKHWLGRNAMPCTRGFAPSTMKMRPLLWRRISSLGFAPDGRYVATP